MKIAAKMSFGPAQSTVRLCGAIVPPETPKAPICARVPVAGKFGGPEKIWLIAGGTSGYTLKTFPVPVSAPPNA